MGLPYKNELRNLAKELTDYVIDKESRVSDTINREIFTTKETIFLLLCAFALGLLLGIILFGGKL